MPVCPDVCSLATEVCRTAYSLSHHGPLDWHYRNSEICVYHEDIGHQSPVQRQQCLSNKYQNLQQYTRNNCNQDFCAFCPTQFKAFSSTIKGQFQVIYHNLSICHTIQVASSSTKSKHFSGCHKLLIGFRQPFDWLQLNSTIFTAIFSLLKTNVEFSSVLKFDTLWG